MTDIASSKVINEDMLFKYQRNVLVMRVGKMFRDCALVRSVFRAKIGQLDYKVVF